MFERWRRRVATAVVVGAMLALCACGADDAAAPAGTALPSSTQPPLSASPPHESEIPPGWDESPDGPGAKPDAELTDTELTALLRTRASSAGGDDSCGPTEVSARLSGVDAAVGHRYTSLVLTNTSSRTCVVQGVPGVGARGEWGHRFTLTVERGMPVSSTTGPVRLAPGAEAQALMEWTGELAGQGAERASLLVAQLASGQVPVRLPARITGAPAGAGDLDLGMFTTIRLGAFERRA